MDNIYSLDNNDNHNNLNIFSNYENITNINNNNLIRNTDLSFNKISSWKKVFADKVAKRINERRESRFESILYSKKEIIEEIKHDNIINGYCDEDNLILSDYFDKILTLFESDKIKSSEYELEVCLNSNISACPVCSYPVVYTSNKVICMNLCFEYIVNSNVFRENFSLDNFIDLLAETYKHHKYCLNSIHFHKFELLLFENEVSFMCGKCFKEGLY